MARSNDKGKTSLTLTAEGKKIDKVFQDAVRNALRQHKAAGNPVAVWRDGRVVILEPKEIKA